MNIREGKEWDKTEGLDLDINQFNSIIKSNVLSLKGRN